MTVGLHYRGEAVRAIYVLAGHCLERYIATGDTHALREASRYLTLADERLAELLRERLSEIDREASLAKVGEA